MIIKQCQLNDFTKEELIELIQLNKLSRKFDAQKESNFCKHTSYFSWDYRNNNLWISEHFSQSLVETLETQQSKIHPDDQQRVYQELIEFQESRDPFFIVEFRILLANQTYRWLEFVGIIDSYDEVSHQFMLLGIHKFSHRESENIEKLKVERAKFKQLFDHFNAGVVLLDKQNIILDINHKFTELFGYSVQEAKGQNVDQLITPMTRSDEGLQYTQQVINGESIEVETVRESKTGEQKDVFVNAFPIKLESDQIGGYAIYYDISDRKEYERYIKYLSFHDELTGLYNRRYFENELQRLDESRQLPISIIMGDMDRLKVINDTYGHKTGDNYLKIIAGLLMNQLRTEDVVARVGGDEFAIILPNTPQSTSHDICKRIKEGAKIYNDNHILPEQLKISLGCATKISKDQPLEKVFNAADKKMYEMKKNNQ